MVSAVSYAVSHYQSSILFVGLVHYVSSIYQA